MNAKAGDEMGERRIGAEGDGHALKLSAPEKAFEMGHGALKAHSAMGRFATAQVAIPNVQVNRVRPPAALIMVEGAI